MQGSVIEYKFCPFEVVCYYFINNPLRLILNLDFFQFNQNGQSNTIHAPALLDKRQHPGVHNQYL